MSPSIAFARPRTQRAISRVELDQVRRQVAMVRALLDEIDRHVPSGGVDGDLCTQAAEEISRLGADLVDAADAIRACAPRAGTPAKR